MREESHAPCCTVRGDLCNRTFVREGYVLLTWHSPRSLFFLCFIASGHSSDRRPGLSVQSQAAVRHTVLPPSWLSASAEGRDKTCVPHHQAYMCFLSPTQNMSFPPPSSNKRLAHVTSSWYLEGHLETPTQLLRASTM